MGIPEVSKREKGRKGGDARLRGHHGAAVEISESSQNETTQSFKTLRRQMDAKHPWSTGYGPVKVEVTSAVVAVKVSNCAQRGAGDALR